MVDIPAHIVVAGKINDAGYHIAKHMVEQLAESHFNITYELKPMFESTWEMYVREQARYLGVDHKLSPIVFYNGRHYVGTTEEFLIWAAQIYGYKPSSINTILYNSIAKKELRKMISLSPNKFIYLDLSIDGLSPLRVVFELFWTLCPHTCTNFINLCHGQEGNKPTFLQTPIHRIVPGGWLQAGDVVDGSGKHSQSYDGGVFADENLSIEFEEEGMLAMVSDGRPHTNGSQFMVSLGPLPWLNKKRVVFGKVVMGMRALKIIEKLSLKNERPCESCVIVNCGEYYGPNTRGTVMHPQNESKLQD